MRQFFGNLLKKFEIILEFFDYNLFKKILSINFNKTATKLCVSSDHGTVHVFILDVPEKNSRSTYVFFKLNLPGGSSF